MNDYLVSHPYFDNIGMIKQFIGNNFILDVTIEDLWLKYVDEYEVQIRNYCRMRLSPVDKAVNLHMLLKVWNKDSPNILESLYDRAKFLDHCIMNEEVGIEKNDDI